MEQLRHPCLQEGFIPNDVSMEGKNIVFLTGPNMGGKSTTLRMVCLAAVLAQIGTPLPLRLLRARPPGPSFARRPCVHPHRSLRPVARRQVHFLHRNGRDPQHRQTRLQTLHRHSRRTRQRHLHFRRCCHRLLSPQVHPQPNQVLSLNSRCRTLFATHYHVLIDEFQNYSQIQFYYMASL